MQDPGTPSSLPGRRMLLALTAAFLGAVIWSAIQPLNPTDYLIEIATPVGGFVALALAWRRLRITRLSTLLLFFECLVLIVGAHYTHEKVPLFDWIRDAWKLERNHFDRFAHFCVGLFCVIPIRELLRRTTPLRCTALGILSVVSLLAFAAFYEISEWWVAALTSPETGAAYLGAQGDPWDTQKDMLLDALGAICGVLLLARRHERAFEGTERHLASHAKPHNVETLTGRGRPDA